MINAVPSALLPVRDEVSIVQEPGWAPGPVWKTSAPPRFDNPTVQLLAIRYTDYANSPPPPVREKRVRLKSQTGFQLWKT